MSTSNQSPQEERSSFAFPLELKILFPVFPATFGGRQSGGMEIVRQHQLRLLPLVPSECLAQSCVNFLKFQRLAADAHKTICWTSSIRSMRRSETAEEWLDNHDFASAIADDGEMEWTSR